MKKALVAALLVACHGGETDTEAPIAYEPLDVYEQLPCAVAGAEGLAVHVQAGAEARYDDTFPVVIRVWPPHRAGFEEVIPTPPLLERGAALVRLLDPGESYEGHTSGGPVGESGLARVEAVRCALTWVNTSFPRPVGAVVLTGQSLGGDTVMHDAFDDGVSGVVLFEPPLVDQLVMDEPAPSDVIDPSFTPGTCTLDGCPFPGRAEKLAFEGRRLWVDLDGSGTVDAGEPVERFLPDPAGRAIGILSLDLLDEVLARSAAIFGGDPPREFPERPASEAYWAYRDATAPLRRASSDHLGRFILVATERDHLQKWHDHVRIAQAALVDAAWFRLNADAAYVVDAGAPDVGELPAFETVDDPDAAGALPEGNDDPYVLAAELELADRAWAGRWEPDLDAVVAPSSSPP